MKGISPMIAIVLLIAFTVAVGGLISLFLTGLTTTQTGTTEAIAINQTKCAGVYITIHRVTGDKIFYFNPSTQPITDVKFTTSDGTTFSSSDPDLAPGESNSTSWNRGTGNTSVTAIGKCLGSIIVSGKCAQGMSCWE